MITLEVEGAKQRGGPRRTWMSDLHIEPNNAMDCSKWRLMIRGNWNNSDTDAES